MSHSQLDCEGFEGVGIDTQGREIFLNTILREKQYAEIFSMGEQKQKDALWALWKGLGLIRKDKRFF